MPLDHADDDFAFAGAQRFLPRFAGAVGRETFDGRDEKFVFDGVVRRQFLLAGENVVEHAVQFVRAARGVVFDDDVLEFVQPRFDLVVLTAEYVYRVVGLFLPREQRFDIGKHRLLLVGHVAVDLGGIFVEIAHDGERHVAQTAIDRPDELAPNGGQPEAEEIAV